MQCALISVYIDTCRNFEDVRKWAETHQAPPEEDIPKDYLQRPRIMDEIYENLP